MRSQSAYRPVLEDWTFHALLPFAGYAGVAVSSALFATHFEGALFAAAGSVLVLLFVGIHNAWDTAAYHVLVHMNKDSERRNVG